MEYAIYLFYRAVVALISALPLTFVFSLGGLLGTLGYWLAAPYRKLVLRNLTIAFSDEKSPLEIRQLAREHFATLGANIFSSVKLATMTPEQIASRVRWENLDVLDAALKSGHGTLGVISHLGAWELFAQMPSFLPQHRFSTIYQKLGNRFIDADVRRTRSRFGVAPFERKEGFGEPIKFLREGGGLAVLVDQHAGDGGLWTPFFDRLASTSPLAATLALRTSAPLVPVAIYTDGPARWRFVVSEPISREEGVTPDQLTARINQALEQQVRVSPRDWFWVHNRWKTPNPKFLLSSYKRGITLPENFPASKLKPFRILIRSTNWLGDAVMSAPTVRAIKNGRPDARVSVLTRSKLADFWKTVAEVDEVISIEPNEGIFRTAKKIAQRNFDVAILFPNSVRVALEAWLADVPRRIGYRAKWRGWLMNRFIRKKENPHPPEHQVFHYLRIAKTVGAEIEPSETAAIGATLNLNPKTVNRIGLCPGAEYGPAKRWLPERFAEVARAVIEKHPECEWQLFGVEKDREIGDEIAQKIGSNCTSLIGKTSLGGLIERLRECRLLLTNDTGTMHLAAHLGVPTVAIFGSTEPALTGPLGAHSRVIRHHVECSPCFLRECPLDFRCMNAVSAEEVTDVILQMLGANERETAAPASRTSHSHFAKTVA